MLAIRLFCGAAICASAKARHHATGLHRGKAADLRAGQATARHCLQMTIGATPKSPAQGPCDGLNSGAVWAEVIDSDARVNDEGATDEKGF